MVRDSRLLLARYCYAVEWDEVDCSYLEDGEWVGL
jgi:hypothetical protein